MYFNSYHFLLFFPIVILVYYLLPHKVRYVWLLISSYYFYMCWNVKYILLLLFVTVVTYLCARGIETVRDKHGEQTALSRWLFIFCVAASLSVLFVYKYVSFLTVSLNELLSAFHITVQIPVRDILLPVGISFYTFQAIGYIADVYRGEVKAEKNPLKYALFVSFFVQLVAGPIERSKDLLSQIKEEHPFDFDRMRDGLLLMMWGFFMKLVLADRAAVLVDRIYDDYSNLPGFYLIVASVLFGFQIYCDFAGYSTIAMGAAKILGFQLTDNFKSPYLSSTVAEFWRNWHVSLTSWFRDYLYIPLGGNRKGKIRKYLNIFIVFLASGLWHGAEWSFVVWGGLNGVYQIIGDVLKPVREKVRKLFKIHKDTLGYRIIATVVTFGLVDFAWIFFRADTIMDALRIIKRIVIYFNPWILIDGSLYNLGLSVYEVRLMGIAIVILLFADFLKKKNICIRTFIYKQDTWFRWLFYLAAAYFIIIFGRYGSDYGSTFIYFQF